MLTKTISAAVLALTLAASAASAQAVKTEAGAGAFDQGGVFFDQTHATTSSAPGTSRNYLPIDRSPTASTTHSQASDISVTEANRCSIGHAQ